MSSDSPRTARYARRKHDAARAAYSDGRRSFDEMSADEIRERLIEHAPAPMVDKYRRAIEAEAASPAASGDALREALERLVDAVETYERPRHSDAFSEAFRLVRQCVACDNNLVNGHCPIHGDLSERAASPAASGDALREALERWGPAIMEAAGDQGLAAFEDDLRRLASREEQG